MKLIRTPSLLTILLFGTALAVAGMADDNGVPIARIDVAASQTFVLAGRTATFTATPYNSVGAALIGRALQWQVSDSRLASIDGNGNLQAFLPGGVIVSAVDPDSGTQGTIPIYVYPGRLTVNLVASSIEAGSTTTCTAQVTDADGNPLPGTAVTLSIADPGIATVAGSTITGQSEGRTQVLASIDMGPGFDAYTGSAVLEVVRRADYKVTRLFTTDTPSTGLKALVPTQLSAFGSYVGSIAALSNGGQGLILQRLGQNPKIIDSAGATIDGTDQIIDSFSAVSVNAAGDVAALVSTPAEWCNVVLLVYRASANWKPVIVPTGSSCSIGLQPRSVDSKGGLFFRLNSDFVHWSPDGTMVRVFGAGDSVAGLKPLGGLNSWGYTPYGNLVFLWADTSSFVTAMAWDGISKFTRITSLTAVVADHVINYIELPVEINPGDFIARTGATNWTGIARFKGTSSSVVIGSGTNSVDWVQSYFDGTGEDIFFHGNFKNGITLFHSNGPNLTPIANFLTSRETGPVYAVSSDTVVNFASTGNAPLAIQQVKGTSSTTILGVGTPVDGSAYLGFTQYAFAPLATAANPLVRTSAGVIMKVTSTGATPVLKPGDTLPGGRALSSISTVTTNRKGDFVFMGQTQMSRSGIWASRNGVLQTLAETDVVLGSGGNVTFQYTLGDRASSYLSMNNKGQVAAVLGTSAYQQIYFFDPGAAPARVVQLNAAAPGGGNYSCCATVRLDEQGRVAFIDYIPGKGGTLFLWDGTNVKRIIGAGDTDPNGHILNGFNDLSAAGDHFYFTANAAGFGNAVYSVDSSAKVASVFGPNTMTTAGVLVNGLFGPNLTSTTANDVLFPTVTPSGNAVVVHKADGTDRIGAITSRKTPDGDWLLTPFPGGVADSGDIFFTAYLWNAGKVRFGLFQASPRQP